MKVKVMDATNGQRRANAKTTDARGMERMITATEYELVQCVFIGQKRLMNI
jgi:hypothetical protein